MAFPPNFDKPADKKPADDKAPPFGGKETKSEEKAEGGDMPADIGSVIDAKSGPIKDVLAKMGRDDIDAKEVLKLAQKDDRTKGKPVEEIASMIEGDETLLDDLIEYRDGGMFQSRGMGAKDAPAGDMPPGDGKMSDEMM